MIMLLDWSGSMCDSIKQTTEQLNEFSLVLSKRLIYLMKFISLQVRLVNQLGINRESKQGDEVFTYKYGDALWTNVI